MGAAGHHGVDQGEHLAPRLRAADPATEADQRVDDALELEAHHQRADQQQPRVRYEVRVVEAHPHAVDAMQYSGHQKCLLGLGRKTTSDIAILLAQEAFLVDARTAQERFSAGSSVDQG